MLANVQNKQRCIAKLFIDTQTLRPESQLYLISNTSNEISY